jgi:hypothetical protein
MQGRAKATGRLLTAACLAFEKRLWAIPLFPLKFPCLHFTQLYPWANPAPFAPTCPFLPPRTLDMAPKEKASPKKGGVAKKEKKEKKEKDPNAPKVRAVASCWRQLARDHTVSNRPPPPLLSLPPTFPTTLPPSAGGTTAELP